MKIRTSAYPFGVSAETKTSKAGKSYTSIGVWQKTKDKDGNKKENYFNMIDERGLLVLARVCEEAYSKIILAKAEDFFKGVEETKDEPAEQVENNPLIDDVIPW